jgi:hypothetical protein
MQSDIVDHRSKEAVRTFTKHKLQSASRAKKTAETSVCTTNMDLQETFPKLRRGVMEKSDKPNKIKLMRKCIDRSTQKYFPIRSKKLQHPTSDAERHPNSKMNRKDAAA